MTERLNHLTVAEHYALGLETSHVRERLLEITVEVGRREGKNGRAHLRLRRALALIDAARSDLDDILFSQHPSEFDAQAWYPG